MTSRLLKVLAVLLLTASLGAVALALRNSFAGNDIQGPGAMLTTARGEVWLAVDRQLWRLNAAGELIGESTVDALGLPGPVENLLRHPSGQVVATVRGATQLYFFDAQAPQRARPMHLHWPAQLQPSGAHGISLAIDALGRVAVATGGGHAVALFDTDGRFLARTAPETYRFSNGLWWVGEQLWTTDTNGFQLKRLDGTSLRVEQTVALSAAARTRYSGPARGRAADAPASPYIAALLRYDNGMQNGEAVLIGHDGSEHRWPQPRSLQPRDLDWLGDSLLVSDGATFSVLRWSADQKTQDLFGDATVRLRLDRLLQSRDALRSRYYAWLGAAIALFVVAFAMAIGAQSLERRQRQQRSPVDLSHLGTPRIPTRELRRQQFQLAALLMLPLLLLFALELGVKQWLAAAPQPERLLTLLAMLTASTLVFAGAVLIWRRMAASPHYESLVNQMALRKLARCDAESLGLASDEVPLETFVLTNAAPRWMLLTSQRLLVFKTTAFDHAFETAHPLADIVAASSVCGGLRPASFWQTVYQLFGSGWVELELRDGAIYRGAVPARALAERVAARLQSTIARAPMAPGIRATAPMPSGPQRGWAALASALLPGLGQWSQRRAGIGLLVFVYWSVVLAFVTAPMVWALIGPRREVSRLHLTIAVLMPLAIAAIAAWDAWRMGRR